MWNGRGARPEEKKKAFDYAVGLCDDADSVIVLNEGENDEDEMFWAVLGDGDRGYAKAFYWAWRADVNTNDPQLWKISASPGHEVCATRCVIEARLMHPSLRTSSIAPIRLLRVASSFWMWHGRYLCSLAPRLGVSGRISC